MKYFILASGSKGNATLIVHNDSLVLIDCGVTQKYLKSKLEEIGYTVDDIQTILLTHDHGDHNRSIHMFDACRVYSHKKCLPSKEANELTCFESFYVDDLEITPFPLSHDASFTVGFTFKSQEAKLTYLTDTGYVKETLVEVIENSDIYIIESNHDVKMLMQTNRPYYLKQRILSDKGHLSNEDSALLGCKLINQKTQEIVLAHLSDAANTEELALDTWFEVLKQKEIRYDHITFKVAKQDLIVNGHIRED